MNAMLRSIAVCVGAAYLWVTPLNAQVATSAPANPVLISTLSLDAFQQQVQALGFATERPSIDGKPAAFFAFRADGRKVAAMTINSDSVELLISFTDGAALETVNEWNSSHYGSAAFVDQKGNALLRSDLILTGGVSQESFNAFITRFRDTANAYGHFIMEHKTATK